MISIIIRISDNQSLLLSIGDENSIKDVKVSIYNFNLTSIESQQLYYGDKLLEDSQTLKTCNISDDSILDLKINQD